MQVDEQNLSEQPAQADTAGDGSLDDAVNALMARGETAEPSDDEAKPAGEAQPEADAEPEEQPGETEEAKDAAAELVEVEFEGKTYKVPPELQKGMLRQSDYSRNMNEVSGLKKQAEATIEQAKAIAGAAEKYAEALAGVRMIEADLERLNGVDWNQLEADNPQQAMRLAMQQIRAQQALGTKRQEAQQVLAGLNEAKEEAARVSLAAMHKALDRDLPGWRGALGDQITGYALESGFKFEEVAAMSDPRIVIALDKARKFDNIEKGKASALKKAQAAPQVLKPGAAKPRVDAANEAVSRLKRSNSVDDAAAAFLAKMG